ncbi:MULTISPECIES: hypothetical protein [Cupriavidus]|uniref:hypothetical protein n=1 Tax=Cupriavidus TaxID=106589 RepID=UPI00164FC445|nr:MULTISPECIES: hypothetical protein [Cupriavidus]
MLVLMGAISLAGTARAGTIQFRGAITEPSCQMTQVSQSRGISTTCSEAGTMTTRTLSDIRQLPRDTRIGPNLINVKAVLGAGASATDALPVGYIVTITYL